MSTNLGNKRRKFHPIRNKEVVELERLVNRCLEYCNAVEETEDVRELPTMNPVETYVMCKNVMFMYGKLIDANYVRRPGDPSFNIDQIH